MEFQPALRDRTLFFPGSDRLFHHRLPATYPRPSGGEGGWWQMALAGVEGFSMAQGAAHHRPVLRGAGDRLCISRSEASSKPALVPALPHQHPHRPAWRVAARHLTFLVHRDPAAILPDLAGGDLAVPAPFPATGDDPVRGYGSAFPLFRIPVHASLRLARENQLGRVRFLRDRRTDGAAHPPRLPALQPDLENSYDRVLRSLPCFRVRPAVRPPSEQHRAVLCLHPFAWPLRGHRNRIPRLAQYRREISRNRIPSESRAAFLWDLPIP